jgi:hypothetical protein
LFIKDCFRSFVLLASPSELFVHDTINVEKVGMSDTAQEDCAGLGL